MFRKTGLAKSMATTSHIKGLVWKKLFIMCYYFEHYKKRLGERLPLLQVQPSTLLTTDTGVFATSLIDLRKHSIDFVTLMKSKF